MDPQGASWFSAQFSIPTLNIGNTLLYYFELWTQKQSSSFRELCPNYAKNPSSSWIICCFKNTYAFQDV